MSKRNPDANDGNKSIAEEMLDFLSRGKLVELFKSKSMGALFDLVAQEPNLAAVMLHLFMS